MEILTQLLFFSTVVFFVLWMSGRKKTNSSDEVDKNSNSYAQGYWDGYKVRKSEEQIGKFENEAYLLEQTGNLDFIADDDEISRAELNDENEEVYVNDEEIKAKHKLQNINTTLYVASFLLVAAVALFIGTSLPEQVRFMGVCFVTALFYISGLYLYDKYEKLKPAATAFVGTGLAILPFVGIAMYNFVLPDASICWLFTSIIGVISFTYAAVKLKNQIVAYLAIVFMISMSTSSVATLGAGLIWYYVVLIVFGSLVTFIATLYPQSLPSAFSKPIQISSQWIVPLTLIASFISFMSLSVTDYWIITLISAIYYVSVAVSSINERDVAILLARLLASLAVILITFDIFDTWMAIGVTTSIVGVAQLMVSSILYRQSQHLDSNTVCLWVSFIMQLIAPLFVMADSSWGLIVTIQLGVLVVNSIGISLYLEKPELSSFGIFSLAIMPIVVGYRVIEPALENYTIAGIYGVMSLILVAIISICRSKKTKGLGWWILLAATSLFSVEALIFVASSDASWRALIWSIVAVIAYYLVYINRRPWYYVISNIVLIGAILPTLEFMGVSGGWCWPIMSWISFLLFYAIYYLSCKFDRETYGISFWWSSVVIGFVVNIGGLTDLGLDQESVTMISLSAFSLIAVAGTIITKGLKDEVYGCIDLGVIICTIAMQRLVGVNVTNLNFLVYTHWWAIVIAGLAYFYHRIGRVQSTQFRSVIALAFISFFTGIMALVGNSDDIPYKVIFLIEHVLILIAGLGFSRKMYAIWGAIGVVLAILWMLSGMTYILLAMLAFGLIGFAIYALTKQSK